jgi:hypothetical protein
MVSRLLGPLKTRDRQRAGPADWLPQPIDLKSNQLVLAVGDSERSLIAKVN